MNENILFIKGRTKGEEGMSVISDERCRSECKIECDLTTYDLFVEKATATSTKVSARLSERLLE